MESKTLDYYNGFMEGVNVCANIMIRLINSVEKSNDVNSIKTLIGMCGETIANISQETQEKIENGLNERRKN